MWAVVGLGNPGRRYSATRHNIGFSVIDRIADKYKIQLTEKQNYISGAGSLEGVAITLIKPLTFMNASGTAVRYILKRSNILPEHLIVIHDDIDMETGKLRIRKNGSSGGHNGIESIIECIGTKDFIRIKIGIGRDMTMPPEDYVLRKFKQSEMSLINTAVDTAKEAVASITKDGISEAMNRFNKKGCFS